MRGDGFDRPSLYDELFLDLKVYQKGVDGADNVVFEEFEAKEYLMTDEQHITPVPKRILQTMKQGEITSTVVLPSWVEENDPEFKNRNADYKADQPLHVDLHLKGLCAIQDLYKDKTVFYKTLKKG